MAKKRIPHEKALHQIDIYHGQVPNRSQTIT